MTDPDWILDGTAALTLPVLAWRVIRAPALSQAVVLFVAFGLVSALAWTRLGAVDVALVEASIGSGLSGALFMSALSWAERRRAWATRPSWWSLPAANSLDRATSHIPKLMYERLDDFGIDFAVLYGSRTLTTTAIRDAEVRQVACRALNAFNAEVYAPYADRMTPAAQIPMPVIAATTMT